MVGTRRSSSEKPQDTTQQTQGNLASALKNYDSHKTRSQSIISSNGLPPVANPLANNNNKDERSSTVGSEFDLGYIMGKDGRGMSIIGEPIITDGESTVSTTAAQQQASGGALMSSLPEHQAAQAIPQQQQPVAANPHRTRARSRGDSTASFLNGMYPTQQPISHTPPTHMGTSYENNHFGKRMRAGSISGRLRSASDLEDTGVISREQKTVLKDLLIAGDSNVQDAIAKYEKGDPAALEEMIKSGALAGRADVDLLGDLDLDFLNVHGGGDDDMFGNVEELVNNSKQSAATGGGAQQQQHDGIGDLEFNGDGATVSVDPTPVVLPQRQQQQVHYTKPRGYSIDDIGVHRMRSNSLALPGMLLEGGEDASSHTFGQWMDNHNVAADEDGQSQQNEHISPNDAASGIQSILNASQFSSDVDGLMGGKTAATLAQVEKKKKKSPKKPKKERKKYTKKDKSEPRERKSQSRMKDMMSGINGTAANGDEEKKPPVVSGTGRPRSMSDPNLSVRLDCYGLLNVDGPEGWVGAYSPTSRHLRVSRFLEKRAQRTWTKKVKYNVRKNFADSRLRVKGRFVKKEDEMLMRELMSLT